jgi:hypothetical protein
MSNSTEYFSIKMGRACMKNYQKSVITVVTLLGLVVGNLFAAPSKNFKVFLCFGQSNMSGGYNPGSNPEKIDTDTVPRVKVLAFTDCSSPSRQKDKWAAASEPIHCGDGGGGDIGPAYAFGKLMADSLPNDTIGLVPCAQWGVAISYFTKGGSYSGNKPTYPGGSNVYDWMIKRCKLAQERGVLSGIIFHQGESDASRASGWITDVVKLAKDIKTDLGLPDSTPFVAGELRADKFSSFNTSAVDKLPSSIPNCYVASSQGCEVYDGDANTKGLHFGYKGYRTIGKNFAIEMVKGLRAIVPPSRVKPGRIVSAASVNSAKDNVNVYSLSGRLVSNGSAMTNAARTSMKPGNIYVVVNKTTGTSANLMIAPTAR